MVDFEFFWRPRWYSFDSYLHDAMFTIKKFVENIFHFFSVGGAIDFVPLSWAEVEVDEVAEVVIHVDTCIQLGDKHWLFKG